MAIERITQNEVREAPATTARFQAADHNAGQIRAKALQGFGQDLGQVAKEVDEIGYRYDVSKAKNADAEDAVALAKIRATALNAVGVEAPAAAEEARKAAEELKRQRLAKLKGRSSQLYMNSFGQRMAQFEESVAGHTFKQVDVAERGAAGARAETSVQLAVDGYDDPTVFASNMTTAKSEFFKANRGMSPDQLEGNWREVQSKAHSQIVQSIATDPERADVAEDWINKHADQIAPAEETQLRKLLRPVLEENEDDASMGQFLGFMQGDPRATPPEDDDYYSADPLAPTPAVPRERGEAPKDVFAHVVSGKGGRISSGYGRRSAPTAGASTNHGGVDIPAPSGTPIRPPMSGRVIKAWNDTAHGGGYSILVQHPNGLVTGYAHMRAPSPLGKGDEVTSTTVIGSVGQTGRATGPHVHMTVRKAGVKVDPQTVDWAAVAGSGGPPMVDPAKATWKESELPRYDADKNAVAGMLGQLHEFATKNNWSSRKYERMVKRVREHAGIEEQAYNAVQDDRKNTALQALVDAEVGGKPLTSVKNIPGFGLLEPSVQLSISGQVEANKKALLSPDGEAVKANGDSYVTYAIAGADPAQRDAFLKMDFRADPNITPGERSRLMLKQQALRNDTNGVLTADMDRVRSVVNRYAPEAGFGKQAKEGTPAFKENRRRQALLIDRTTALIDRHQKQAGRPLNDIEIDGIVRSQVVGIVRGGEEIPLYIARTTARKEGEVDAVNPQATFESIPTVVKQQIIRGLQARGVTPTPRLVIEAYLEGSR